MTISQAIKAYCTDCSDGYKDRQSCTFTDCPLWVGRNGRRPKGYQPAKKIREYCVNDCMNKSAAEVLKCTAEGCFLYKYRLGRKIVLEQQDNHSLASKVGVKNDRIEPMSTEQS